MKVPHAARSLTGECVMTIAIAVMVCFSSIAGIAASGGVYPKGSLFPLTDIVSLVIAPIILIGPLLLARRRLLGLLLWPGAPIDVGGVVVVGVFALLPIALLAFFIPATSHKKRRGEGLAPAPLPRGRGGA